MGFQWNDLLIIYIQDVDIQGLVIFLEPSCSQQINPISNTVFDVCISNTVFDVSTAGTEQFPAQKLRTIFVEERRSAEATEAGPSDLGASLAMGNSPNMWDRVYDRTLKRREMQEAVDAMQAWRQAAVGDQPAVAVETVMPASSTCIQLFMRRRM